MNDINEDLDQRLIENREKRINDSPSDPDDEDCLHLMKEDLHSLHDICNMVPTKPNHSTVFRWSTRGIVSKTHRKKVYLETIKLGRTRFTTTQALQRFLRDIQ